MLTNDPPLENMVVSSFVQTPGLWWVLFELQLLHYELGISDFMTIPSTLIPVDGFETWRAAVSDSCGKSPLPLVERVSRHGCVLKPNAPKIS